MSVTEIRTPLVQICEGIDGVLAATVMGFDGLPVDTYQPKNGNAGGHTTQVDVPALMVEYSSMLGQIQRSAQMFSAGGLEELAITSENLRTVIRPLSEDYFVAIAMTRGANMGRGRYLLRLHAPKLQEAI